MNLDTRIAGYKRVHLIFCICALSALTGSAQVPARKIREFAVGEVSKASLDRLGNLYLVFKKGSVRRYDTDGNFMNEFSNPESAEITLFEPWNPLRIFIYGRTRQEILLLDHNLTLLEKVIIDPSLAVTPVLVSPTPNNSYWILDGADYSLRKIDPKSTSVLQEVRLKPATGKKPDFTFLREYQNLLFLVDQQTGVQILSVVGKPIRSLPVKDLSFLGFFGPEIYYLDNGIIRLFDLYSEEQRELKADPLAQIVLLTDERMIVVKKSMVEVWEYKP